MSHVITGRDATVVPEAPQVVLAAGASGSTRLGWVDLVRGLLVVGVVLGHAVYFLSWREARAETLHGVLQAMKFVRLPLLFLLSGALFAVYAARPWPRVMRRRVVPMVWLVLVWLVVERVVRSVAGVLPVPTPAELARYVSVNLVGPPVDYLWFIWALAVASLLCRALVRARWALLGLALPGVLGVYARWVPEQALGRQTTSVLLDTPYFLVGFCLAPLVLRATTGSVPRRLLVGLAAVAGGAVVWWAALLLDLDGSVERAPISLVLVAVSVPALALLGQLVASTRVGHGFVWLGRRTLPIYVVHLPALVLSLTVVDDLLLEQTRAAPTVAALVLTVVAVGAGLLLHLLTTRTGVHGVFDPPAWVDRRVVVPSSATAQHR